MAATESIGLEVARITSAIPVKKVSRTRLFCSGDHSLELGFILGAIGRGHTQFRRARKAPASP